MMGCGVRRLSRRSARRAPEGDELLGRVGWHTVRVLHLYAWMARRHVHALEHAQPACQIAGVCQLRARAYFY
jgi:hypothetical protein